MVSFKYVSLLSGLMFFDEYIFGVILASSIAGMIYAGAQASWWKYDASPLLNIYIFLANISSP